MTHLEIETHISSTNRLRLSREGLNGIKFRCMELFLTDLSNSDFA